MSRKRLVIKQTNPWGVLLIVLFAAAFLVGIALLAFPKNIKSYRTSALNITLSSKEGFIFYKASTSKQLNKELNLYGLYERYSSSVKPYLLEHFPYDFCYLPPNKRKKMFIAVMLPIALVVKEQLDQEHDMVERIKLKMDYKVHLNKEEKEFIKAAMIKYRTNNINELVKRVDSIPVSLLIAQAGIESGWGSSRFSILYNNIYGLHRKHRRPWQPIVMSFGNLYDATVAYVMNLNRSMAYRKFRNARYMMGEKLNPYKLAEYLTMYSVKRNEYIKLVQHIMLSNRLSQYDNFNVQQIVVSNYPKNEDIQ